MDKDRSEGAAVRERAGLGSAWCVGKAVGCVEPHDASHLQAIMLSICLQSMVDELMVKKSGGSIRKVRVGLDVVSGVGSHPARDSLGSRLGPACSLQDGAS